MAHIVLYAASRRRWRPEAVHFRHRAPADLSVFRRFFPCRLEFGSSFDGFEVTPASFDEKWSWARQDMAAHAERLLELVPVASPTSNVAEQVNRSLALLLPSGRTSLDDVAENLGTYGRALQRRLEERGETYGDLLNKARRELSQRYLANDSQTISSVAELAGYSSLSSFTRWFAGEFGMPPRQWRAQVMEGAARAA
jgi:AraC-like DNA-binding protein